MAGNQATQTRQASYEAQFYSVKQFSEIVGCSKSKTSVDIKRGIIPCVRIGAYPYIGKAYVDALIAKANGGVA
jgi:hypothetical protein